MAAPDDKLTVKEWAKRYRIPEEELNAFCAKMGLTFESEFTREEFKNLIKPVEANAGEPQVIQQESPVEIKEERVTEERKVELSKLAAEKGVTRPCVAALKVYTGWEDSTKITEAELDAAVDKYLKGKE